MSRNNRDGWSDALDRLKLQQIRRQDGRTRRYALRNTAGKIMPGEAVARCGRFACEFNREGPKWEKYVAVKLGDSGAHFSGIVTCGSVWHCPVCAAKIAARRREEILAQVEAHRAAGGKIYMVAATVPHHSGQSLREIKKGLALAWSKTINGNPWKRATAKIGLVKSARSIEITHGENGWHPHHHILFFLNADADADAADAFGAWLFERWYSKVESVGLGQISDKPWKFERARDDVQAAEYVAKWGCVGELTGSAAKQAGQGSRTPWDILAACHADGLEGDVKLWQEYAITMKGARQLTWSRPADAGASDEEIAEAEPKTSQTAGLIHESAYRTLVDTGAAAHVLELVENGGWPAVRNYFIAAGLPLNCLSEGPGGRQQSEFAAIVKRRAHAENRKREEPVW